MVYVYVFLTHLLISSLLVIITLLIIDISSVVSLRFYWVSSNLLRVKKAGFDSEKPKFACMYVCVCVCLCLPVCVYVLRIGAGKISIHEHLSVL